MKITEHTKEIEGITYQITVRSEADDYFGSWFCKKCRAGGVKYELVPTINEAMMRAEIDLTKHHAKEHALAQE